MPPRSSGRAHAQYLHGWPSLGTRPAEAVHLTGVVAGRHEPGLVVVQLHSAQSLMREAASALQVDASSILLARAEGAKPNGLGDDGPRNS